jgi:hypothetical protein
MGSPNPSRPSSHSNSPATPVTGLVIDAMANSASSGIGALRSGPRWPTASWKTRRPWRATAATAPGNWPASISAFSAGTIRESLVEDMPTASGSVRGRVCWFAVVPVIPLLPVPLPSIPGTRSKPVGRNGGGSIRGRRMPAKSDRNRLDDVAQVRPSHSVSPWPLAALQKLAELS